MILENNFKARVGFEPTITGLQPVALATWPPRLDRKMSLFGFIKVFRSKVYKITFVIS